MYVVDYPSRAKLIKHFFMTDKRPLSFLFDKFYPERYKRVTWWKATSKKQRITFVRLAQRIRKHSDFASQNSEHTGTQNRENCFRYENDNQEE